MKNIEFIISLLSEKLNKKVKYTLYPMLNEIMFSIITSSKYIVNGKYVHTLSSERIILSYEELDKSKIIDIVDYIISIYKERQSTK